MYPHTILLSLALFYLFQPTIAASPSAWRSRSIYQVVTDRFARSDGSTTFPCSTSDRLYCGGSWRGIINHLDYISDMGFTAIWISPIQKQVEGDTYEGEAYHGYWPNNLNQINEHFGEKQDLLDLVAECHRRDIFVMLDMVFNHLASQGEDMTWSDLEPFNDERFFHPRCPIDWGNEASIQNCWMGDGYVSLADVDTENTEVIETFKSYISNLVDEFSFDGLRLDAVRNIPKPFWPEITRASNVYCQGEVWVGDANVVAPYQEYIDGMHNYPVKEAATRAFISSTSDLSELITVASDMQSLSKDLTLFGNFMENHDNPRLASITQDFSRLQTAAVWNILGADGIPIVYYGQEQKYAGAKDPANREALWLSGYKTTDNLVPTFATLNRFRNFVIAQGDPFLTTLAQYALLTSAVMSARKGNVTLVLTNAGNGGGGNVVLQGFAAGMELVEMLTCGKLVADQGGSLALVLNGNPIVLYPRSLLQESGLCGL
ncbi:glycoside hydrolase family 13 protein [Roridomyces roridus]|uniref:alpha-amylase n=1 Tax=Roridomyces roridus TaxID=1738132 RepID=A0AAD7FZD5_9AGAR|nr:glycoside hydrolase family 13 protein [Roridomyces roridus]